MARPPPRQEPPIEGLLLLLIGALLLTGVAAAAAATRAGLPVLVAFLGLGMALGSDGPGGIAFEDADLARTVATIGLVAILWEGGLTTTWSDIRPVLVPAAALSTAGVLITAVVVGLGAYALLDLSMVEAMLLGAVVGSTDAAAVFSTLRFTTIRRKVAALLEAESGTNDPVAVALTLGLIAWVTVDGYGPGNLALSMVRELGIGMVLGIVLGAVAAWGAARVPPVLGPFASVLSLGLAAVSFGLAEVAGGSGFLVVYLVALRLGNTPHPFRRELTSFHQGLAFLAQVVLFVVLGLLVFPSDLLEVVLPGIALAGVLTFLARPAAVWLCTIGQRIGVAERVLLSWAGLRGAVPIVLATFVLSEGLRASDTIFNAVFFAVLLSAAIQGPTLEPLARRLGLAEESRPFYQPPLEIGATGRADILEFPVGGEDAVVGMRVRELGIPRTALLAVIVRDRQAIPPRGRTTIEAGDRLYVLTRAESLARVEELLATWRTGPAP